MSDFKARLETEASELAEKLKKLTEFLKTNPQINEHQLALLYIQHGAMQTYLSTLNMRMDLLKVNILKP